MIRIGASNWSQSEIRKTLPPAKLAPGAMLEAYARVLETVEINSTFYRFYQAKTFVGWKERVPPGFIFAIKANCLFTHERQLEGPAPELRKFFADISGLENTLGPVLFQLPASFHLDLARLRSFIASLKRAMLETGCRPRLAFELRHPSWHVKEVFHLLERSKMAFCHFDIRMFTAPLVVTTDFTYIRLHGPTKIPYQGAYGKDALLPWAEHLLRWNSWDIDSYVYFDNTRFGEAVPDALILKELTGIGRAVSGGFSTRMRTLV